MARVRDTLGVSLPLDQIFRTPTLTALARSIEALRGPLPSETETREQIEI